MTCQNYTFSISSEETGCGRGRYRENSQYVDTQGDSFCSCFQLYTLQATTHFTFLSKEHILSYTCLTCTVYNQIILLDTLYIFLNRTVSVREVTMRRRNLMREKDIVDVKIFNLSIFIDTYDNTILNILKNISAK